MDLDFDFEEISDGELEQESGIKGIGDALGVDWASLAKETQRPLMNAAEDFYNSTKYRWTGHRIIWDIGISAKLAGLDFAKNKLIAARNELRREKLEWQSKQADLYKDGNILNGDLKKEITDDAEVKPNGEVKEEQNENRNGMEMNIQEDFEIDNEVIIHPLAQVQVLIRKIAVQRNKLILNSTRKYGRALSARKDLKLRRRLYNLPKNDLQIDKSCTTNSDIIKNAEETFRKLIDGIN